MRLEDILYDLPEDLIAQSPLAERDASRLMVLDKRTGATAHRTFRDVPHILKAGDLLVLNDTRVTAVRLLGVRKTGAKVEALLLNDHGQGEYTALVKPAKKLKPGETIEFEQGLQAEVLQDEGEGRKRLAFRQSDYKHKLAQTGRVPLPPYVHTALQDPARYQTVYAQTAGSAAAPTAGLHFTAALLNQLQETGVQTARVTLDVGLDTFRPVSEPIVEDHKMHGERCSVPRATAQAIERCKGRIVAVGTTTVRTLESFATGPRSVEPGEMTTTLFINPGHRFEVVDAMFTNFHMPGTTMLLLVSALAGREGLMAAYREAVEKRYRFLSFGDSMLVL